MLCRCRVFQAHDERQPHIGNERQWMRRINGEWRQNRKDTLLKQRGKLREISLIETFRWQDRDPGLFQFSFKLAPDPLLLFQKKARFLPHRSKLLRGCSPIGAAHDHPFPNLPDQTRNTDGIKFIKITGTDRQEANPFQQRISRAFRFFNDTLVEIEPGQFTIDKPLRRRWHIRIVLGCRDDHPPPPGTTYSRSHAALTRLAGCAAAGSRFLVFSRHDGLFREA